METKSMTFMAACRDYFGQLPGQTTLQFGAEIKALHRSDREEITKGLEALGYKIQSAVGAPTSPSTPT